MAILFGENPKNFREIFSDYQVVKPKTQVNIPQAGDIISQSQPQLLTNSQQLNLVYGDPNPAADPNSDHYPFDDASSNASKHRKVRLPETSSTPPTPLANEGVIYGSQDGDTNTYPYWRRDTRTTDYPMLPIKAFGECTVANPSVLNPNSFGVTAVTRIGTGQYHFDFTEIFADTNYSVQCLCKGMGTSQSSYTIPRQQHL